MIYNDYKFATDQEYNIMKKSYTQSLANKNSDLGEICQKMEKQRDFLKTHNTSHQFADALQKLDNSIKHLKRIVESNDREINKLLAKVSHSQIDNDTVISPFRHLTEIPDADTPLPPTNNDSSSNINETTPNSIQAKRSCPQQGNPIFNAFRQIDVRLGKMFGFKKSSVPTSLNKNKSLPHECQPSEIIKHNQMDIVRLLLLYMMINPNCRFLPTICNVANAQYDILLQVF